MARTLHEYGYSPRPLGVQMSKIRTLGAAALAVAGLAAIQFAVALPAEARYAKCAAHLESGNSGVVVTSCSTKRP